MSRTKKTNLYVEIKEGLEEMVAVEKGECQPARVRRFFTIAELGVSNRTLQEWEQGRRRTPTGPAMNLLRLYEAMPEAITKILSEEATLVS
jgi:hypothetical protein